MEQIPVLEKPSFNYVTYGALRHLILSVIGIIMRIISSNPQELRDLTARLTKLGASIVCPESQVQTPSMIQSLQTLGPPPKLGLNLVGGRSGLNLARLLGHNAQFITFGGMSREPVSFPTSLFIFKDLNARGFWLSRWNSQRENLESRRIMLKELLQLQDAGKLIPPKLSNIDFADLKKHLRNKVLLS
jgi:trans-2-enoyl-CoA reductase